jgi:hypothetical protein
MMIHRFRDFRGMGFPFHGACSVPRVLRFTGCYVSRRVTFPGVLRFTRVTFPACYVPRVLRSPGVTFPGVCNPGLQTSGPLTGSYCLGDMRLVP